MYHKTRDKIDEPPCMIHSAGKYSEEYRVLRDYLNDKIYRK